MIVKSVIAGTVLSLMAGGVVYFGTDIDAGELTDKVAAKAADVKDDISEKIMAGGKEHPHETKKASIDTPSVKTQSGQLIDPKSPIMDESSSSDEKVADAAQGSELSPEGSKPQKKWLNQYLKKDAPKGEDAPEDTDVTDANASGDDVRTETVTTKTVTTEEVVTQDIEAPEDTRSVAQDLMASMGLTPEVASNEGSDSDTGTFFIEDELTEEDIEAAEAEGFAERVMQTENIWTEDDTDDKNATRKMLRGLIKKDHATVTAETPNGEPKNIEVKVINGDEGRTTIETETIDMGDGKIVKIVKKTVKTKNKTDDNGDMRIRVFTDKDGKGGLTTDDIEAIKSGNNVSIHKLLKEVKAKDISATVKVVMEQAEKINMPELRDRAYLDLVSYGLDHGDYEVASKALKKIEQVELRDTARNRIAVTYAKDGNAEEAFGILDDLEVDALRDVMRLQVIEAMIAPEELPKDMQ